MIVIDNLVPSKNKRINGTSQDWFDAQIIEKINERDKLYFNAYFSNLAENLKSKLPNPSNNMVWFQ